MAEKLAKATKKIALALFYILIYFALLYFVTIQVTLLEEDLENYSGVITILSSLAAVAIYAVMFYIRRIKPNRYIKTKPLSLVDIVLSFTTAIGFRLLTGAYLMWSEENVPLLQRSIENAQQSYDFNTMTAFCSVSVVLSVCIVAPIFEEILFRGIVQKELSGVMPVICAIILQGLLFGMAHAVLAQSIFAAVYGIVLGLIYYRTRNIYIVMCSHVFFNISSVLEIRNYEMIGRMVVSGMALTAVSIFVFFYIHEGKKPSAKDEALGGKGNV